MPMKVLVLTGGFHPEMPREEIKSLGVKIEIKEGSIVVGEVSGWERLKKLGYSHLVLEYLGKFQAEEDLPFDPEEHIKGSFAARFKKIDFSDNFDKVKNRILERLNPHIEEVDLDSPDTVLYFLLKDEQVYCGKLLHEFDASEFRKREPEFRPFSRPVSLPPREARCWINLSGITEGERLLDPFCGPGGIVMEGSLMGYKAYGSDSEGEMVSGCRINLNYYNADDQIRKCDVQNLGEIWNRKFDAVVTDPPYGRSSRIRGGKLEDLYKKALDEIHGVLSPQGRLVIGAPERLNIEDLVENSRFKKRKKFKERVHGDLSREVFVLEKT